MNEAIAKELINLVNQDQKQRKKLDLDNKAGQGYDPEMEVVHRQNAARLKEIINEIGWPTISKVGAEASDAAWKIVQHAVGEPAFMKQCLQLLEENMEDINPQNFAYLYDRISYFEGKPQKFGTQFHNDKIYPVKNKAEINYLRQTIQLEPLELENITEIKPPVFPKDFFEDAGFNAWRKKVGWVS
jgi:hypothetical protein